MNIIRHMAGLSIGGLAGLLLTRPQDWEDAGYGFALGLFGAVIGLGLNLAMLIPKYSPRKRLGLLLGTAGFAILMFLVLGRTAPNGEGVGDLLIFLGIVLAAGIACYSLAVLGSLTLQQKPDDDVNENHSVPKGP